MQFSAPPRRRPPESIVPMINVVFLLLIFFLMTAEIAPPAPFEVTPPVSDSGSASEATLTLYVDAEGRPGFRDLVGDAALEGVAAEAAAGNADVTLTIRADAAAPAATVAGLLRQLGTRGIGAVTLATVPQ